MYKRFDNKLNSSTFFNYLLNSNIYLLNSDIYYLYKKFDINGHQVIKNSTTFNYLLNSYNIYYKIQIILLLSIFIRI